MTSYIRYLVIFVFCLISYIHTEDDRALLYKTNEQLRDESLGTINLDDLGKMFTKLMDDINNGAHDSDSCSGCNVSLTYARILIKDGGIIRLVSGSACKNVKQSQRVCSGVLNLMSDSLAFIFQHTKLTTPEMCGALLHPDCMTQLKQPMSPKLIWELPLPPKKPFTPKTGPKEELKMIHVTDAHLDLWYTPGSNSMCNEPLCCRSTSYGHNSSAGYWSQCLHNCDTPISFAESSIEDMARKHQDLDFVIWTGDNIPHDVWNTTQTVNLLHIDAMTNAIKSSFSDKMVFPCLGNHETHPINMYIPTEVSAISNGTFSMSWLYDTLADNYWSKWINTEAAKRTFKKGGYYSAQVNEALKVIALNNAMAQRGNYWVGYDPVDPDGQIQWLIDELDSAETQGQYAMIIGHIPPNECYVAWTNNYYRIMERYQHLIVGTYFGHTHKDEILVLYNIDKDNKPYAVSHAYLGSSLTTYSALNPGYRLFTLDNKGEPIDFTMYYSNVTEDNIEGRKVLPKWSFGYSAKQSYQLESLSTKSWDEFITKAKTDDNLTKTYFQRFYRFSEAFLVENQYTIEDMRQNLQNRKAVNPIHDIKSEL
ncbi:sphingomyelin phosphodiesterase-like [Oppia nitens]|uniref:sphingomyelin phosphodiesterase-like n=1 Tax=Oppia nitens TaxID=1686743 RepID=UPI0023DAEDDB|nr:sphingomyelin phosphodiesterase-like [Oppia nitens]